MIKFPGFREVIRRDAEHQIELIEGVIKTVVEFERDRCARIARENFLVTPNGRDCGEHIAKQIERP